MFLHVGLSVTVPKESVLGIFDLDNTSWSFRTRGFLEQMEAEGRVVPVGDDLPRSFILCQDGNRPPIVYLTQLNTATLLRRAEGDGICDL